MPSSFHMAGSFAPSAEHVSAFADSVCRTLRVARALVEADRDVALAGLENTVGMLCARTLDLPPDLGLEMRRKLVALREETEALTAALAERAESPGWMFKGRRP